VRVGHCQDLTPKIPGSRELGIFLSAFFMH
jgi:hypothetical protein